MRVRLRLPAAQERQLRRSPSFQEGRRVPFMAAATEAVAAASHTTNLPAALAAAFSTPCLQFLHNFYTFMLITEELFGSFFNRFEIGNKFCFPSVSNFCENHTSTFCNLWSRKKRIVRKLLGLPWSWPEVRIQIRILPSKETLISTLLSFYDILSLKIEVDVHS